MVAEDMDFFGIGPLELLLIMVIALLVIGPEKLPGMAQKLGKTVSDIKRSLNDASKAVTDEIRSNEITKELKDVRQKVSSDLIGIRQAQPPAENKPARDTKADSASPTPDAEKTTQRFLQH